MRSQNANSVCTIRLACTLVTMPELFGNCCSVISVKRQSPGFQKFSKADIYYVLLSRLDTQFIVVFGYPGMTLEIEGELAPDSTDIIAKRIFCIDFPESGPARQAALKNDLSYLFNRTGQVRKEYTYIH